MAYAYREMVKMAKQEEKKWYESKTLWTNVLVIVGGVATAVAGELQAGGVLTFVGVANIILRVVTKTQLKK